ncbi:MAG: aspartate carbamoyltransferase catalytic subunit [Thalassovita sp.]
MNGWDGILEPGEEIIWQGRPKPGLSVSQDQLGFVAFGFLFAGFALFWMLAARQSGGVFWMFGLIHFTVGLGVAVGSPLREVFLNSNTWYTLTDRRAFVATRLLGQRQKLLDYAITPETPLRLEHGPLSTVWFGFKADATRWNRHNDQPCFARLEDGQSVYRHLRDVQQNQRVLEPA